MSARWAAPGSGAHPVGAVTMNWRAWVTGPPGSAAARPAWPAKSALFWEFTR